MPALSRSQQRLFGMIHAWQKGKLKKAPKKIKSLAKRIDPQSAKDFAETKHEDLPEKVAETQLWRRFGQPAVELPLDPDTFSNYIRERLLRIADAS